MRAIASMTFTGGAPWALGISGQSRPDRAGREAETALQILELIQDPQGGSTPSKWWRRWASNPRPETLRDRHLHPEPVVLCSRHPSLQPDGCQGGPHIKF